MSSITSKAPGVNMTPYYTLNINNYDGKHVEAGWSAVFPGRRQNTVRGSSLNREENKTRSRRRAKSQIRKKILAGNFDYLLTLTFKENITDLKRANSYFDKFIRKVRKHIDKNFAYVAVAEKQKRGAYHFHVAVKGWQKVKTLRAIWLRIVGEGNIDVRAPLKRKSGSQWEKVKLAYYLSKYIAKDDTDELNKNLYRVSQGIEIPVEKIIYAFGSYMLQEIEIIMQKYGGYNSNYIEGQFGWVATWSQTDT